MCPRYPVPCLAAFLPWKFLRGMEHQPSGGGYSTNVVFILLSQHTNFLRKGYPRWKHTQSRGGDPPSCTGQPRLGYLNLMGGPPRPFHQPFAISRGGDPPPPPPPPPTPHTHTHTHPHTHTHTPTPTPTPHTHTHTHTHPHHPPPPRPTIWPRPTGVSRCLQVDFGVRTVVASRLHSPSHRGGDRK